MPTTSDPQRRDPSRWTETSSRRIAVYLERDSPQVADRDEVAARLAQRLFQYVRQEAPASDRSEALTALLPEAAALLLFTAQWDGNSSRYRPVVDSVARKLATRLVPLDVDDAIGGAIAKTVGVANVPAVALVENGEVAVLVTGSRGEADLLRALRERA